MPFYSKRAARVSAMPILASLIVLNVSQIANAEEGQAAPSVQPAESIFVQAPLPETELAATTGREQSTWLTASTKNSANISDNHVGDNNVTGAVNVTDSAFQNASGISMVNFNTGNNSSINAAMSVNLHITYAAPSAP